MALRTPTVTNSIKVVFLFADDSTETITITPIAQDSTAITNINSNLTKTLDAIKERNGKSKSRLDEAVISDSGSRLSDIKSAQILFQTNTRIFDASIFEEA